MSSLMRLLSHRSSAAEGGNNEGRNNNTGFASASATSSAPPKSGSSFPASPSINDFSMGTAADIAEWDATTVEKALPSPATSLGRVDGRRSLDSVLSNTSVFGGGAAGGAGANTSLASSPLSSPPGALSSRASLDSARGSADVRALLWRASMPASFGPTRTPAVPIPGTAEEARRASYGGGIPSSPAASSAPVPIPLSPSLFGSHAAGSAPAPAAVAAAGAGAAFGSPFKGGAAAGGGVSPAAAPSTPRAVPVAASATAELQAATSPGKRSPSSRRRGGKIDGLDYYEYVELIRASSL